MLFEKFNLLKFRLQGYCQKIFMDRYTKRFIEYSHQVWKTWRNKNPQGVILLYYSAISSGIISASYFTNVLARKHGAQIKAFSCTRKSFLWNSIYWKRDAVYASFNVSQFIRVKLNFSQKAKQKAIVDDIAKKLKTKENVHDICLHGISLGIDIYETYLRACNQPTVHLNDPRLLGIIKEGVGILLFWEDYIVKNKVKSIVVSHDAYIYENILCKIGYREKIPVYMPNIKGLYFAQRPYTVNDPLFRNYHKLFQQLTPNEQAEGLAIAQRQMQLRLSGRVGVDMPYSTKSAFDPKNNQGSVLRKSNKIKILICSHCFYDNPYAYGNMLFIDFYEWLSYLGAISQKTDYDWYIKTHPDPLPGTAEIIQDILNKYPKITCIPPSTSHHQLVSEGINFILTAYGSVGHELAMLGLQVINAGYNPHYAYNFNWHPKTIKEYEAYLMDLGQLNKEINKDEIYEFYYMHYYYTINDGLFFDSYHRYLADSQNNKKSESSIYEYFLDQINPQKHTHICEVILNFIESGKNYCLSQGSQN